MQEIINDAAYEKNKIPCASKLCIKLKMKNKCLLADSNQCDTPWSLFEVRQDGSDKLNGIAPQIELWKDGSLGGINSELIISIRLIIRNAVICQRINFLILCGKGLVYVIILFNNKNKYATFACKHLSQRLIGKQYQNCTHILSC